MIGLRLKSVRARLTVWHVLMLAGVMAVYLAGVSLLLFWQMGNVLKSLGRQDVETIKGLLYVTSSGRVGLDETYHHHSAWRQVEERLIEVLAPDGTVLYQNERLGSRRIDGTLFAGEGATSYSERFSRLSDGSRVIVISRTYVLQGRPVLIRVAYSLDLIWDRLRQTLAILLLGLPLALAAAALAGYQMAGRALKPIGKLTRRAQEIDSQRLNERVPVENPEDELGQLAGVLNQMLSRIEQSFDQLKRFTADASHELRTPLAAIRSIGEVALHQEKSPEEYRDIIGSMLEEVNHLTRIVESLLTLSRAEAGQTPIEVSVFPMMGVVDEAAALLEVLRDEKHLTLTVSGDSACYVSADRLQLRQAVINILHNAIKFTPEGGRIGVQVGAENHSTVVLSVTDSGPGIPAEQIGRVFERFHRLDQMRGQENNGAGLGLSIAKWAVTANGGEIGVSSSGSGEGCTFWVRLPKATSNPSAGTVSQNDGLRALELHGSPPVGS